MSNLLSNEKFELEADGEKIIVTEHTVQDQQVYRLVFNDKRLPLVITRAPLGMEICGLVCRKVDRRKPRNLVILYLII